MYTTMHSPKMTMNLQHISHKEYFFQNLQYLVLPGTVLTIRKMIHISRNNFDFINQHKSEA
jgi:hypothetical protein